MRDIPCFETEFGTAGLVLNQIPCTGKAYVHILQTQQLPQLLKDCVGFCRVAGADRIYACGEERLKEYSHYTDVLRMSRPLEGMDDTTDCLLPVTVESCEQWRQIYNEKMAGVDNAAILSQMACRKLIAEGGAYFVHREGRLLGIGIASGEQIQAIASLVPGQGAQVLKALCHALSGPMVYVEVASTNGRAIRLYENMGFIPNGILHSWYQVL